MYVRTAAIVNSYTSRQVFPLVVQDISRQPVYQSEFAVTGIDRKDRQSGENICKWIEDITRNKLRITG